MIERYCNKCGVKLVKEENWYSSQVEKCNYICIDCNRAYHKDYYYGAGFNTRLMYRYGITLEDYKNLLFEQNGVCKICGNVNKSGKRLAIDHDHKTGRVRGLLCNLCNTRLVYIEDKEFLQKALLYLGEEVF